MGNQHAVSKPTVKGKDPSQDVKSESVERGGSLDTSVLPEEDAEFFFSVAVVDGIAPCERDGGVGNPSLSCAYWRSKTRERRLEWALHRGLQHGCQPALFWTTPFLESSSLTPQTKGKVSRNKASQASGSQSCSHLAGQPTDAQSSTCSLLTRHLSQFAYDFVFNGHQNGSASSKEAREGNGGTSRKKGKGRHDSKRPKRLILVYIVAADHLSDQVGLITKMWEEAPAELDGANTPPDAGFEVKVVQMKRSHFHENIVRIPPRALDPDKDCHDNAKSGVFNDDGTSFSVERLAALRGAGLLYGYPALVFDCNPLTLSCICCDSHGHILGSGMGSGLSGKLQTKPRAAPACNKKGRIINEHHLEPSFEKTMDEVKKILCDTADEISASSRTFISRWLHQLNCSWNDVNNSVSPDYRALLYSEEIARAIQEDRLSGEQHRQASKPPIVETLYERHNEKRNIVTCGPDSKLFVHLIGSSKPAKNNANPTIAVPRSPGEYDKEEFHFPWADSTVASFPLEGDVTNKSKEACNQAPRDTSRPRRCAIIHNRHLIQYGVTAAIMGNYISRRYRNTVIGRRVAKCFLPETAKKKRKKGKSVSITGGKIFRGCVGAVHVPTDDYREEKVWYYIEYDDGDSEHVAREELIEMLRLYAKVGEGDSNTTGKATQDDATKPAHGESEDAETESENGGEQKPKKRRRPASSLGGQYYFW